MKYISTRGNSKLNSSYEVILKGLSDDGGLYLPESFPEIEFSNEEIEKLDYIYFAKKIIGSIFDDFNKEELYSAIELAYSTFKGNIVPIKKLDNKYVIELYHGQTFAFKDFALSLLPRLISIAIKHSGLDKKILVLTATSGDTGSAALYGFKNVENTDIAVFYPTDGISEIQERQMVTLDGKNTHAIAIRGNFDDAQSSLKKIFNDVQFREYLNMKGYELSSANSINIGRLIPQTVYYFYSYYYLVKNGYIKNGEKISVSVPTGNFGNILAAYLSKKMGLPINNLICASNKNNVLTEFINRGIYNINREFFVTNSPSMDILISSNLERFLYYELGEDSEEIKFLMESLMKNGKYFIDSRRLNNIMAYYFDDDRTIDEIKKIYDEYNYLVDTHTAIGLLAAQDYEKFNKGEKILVAATASPFKFINSIAEALMMNSNDEISALNTLEEKFNISVPVEFKDLFAKDIKNKMVIEKDEIKDYIRRIIK